MTLYKLISNMPIFALDICTKPPYEVHIQATDVSDGYHTMDELYEHRNRLFLALVKVYDNYITPLGCNIKCWKFKENDKWFILGMTATKHNINSTIEKYDISYHLPMKYWDLARVIELQKAPPFDGYTSNDVLERLLRL